MDSEEVKAYFEIPEVVEDYARATERVGLWESEKIVFCKYIAKGARILELGCGAGRIALGMYALGYRNIVACDISEGMVRAAESLAKKRGAEVDFLVVDAVNPPFENASFGAAIFGFNGLMQIPKRENRKAAMREIFRMLSPGGVFVFTTHDRLAERNREYWQMEQRRWKYGVQFKKLDEFGDIVYDGLKGQVFIHSPDSREIEEDLLECGFVLLEKSLRSSMAEESESVVEFSDDCVFWIAKKSVSAEH